MASGKTRTQVCIVHIGVRQLATAYRSTNSYIEITGGRNEETSNEYTNSKLLHAGSHLVRSVDQHRVYHIGAGCRNPDLLSGSELSMAPDRPAVNNMWEVVGPVLSSKS